MATQRVPLFESKLPKEITAQEAYEIAKDAYVYAYPLILQAITLRQMTNFAEPTGIPGQGPFNRFSHSPAFPPSDFKMVVCANVDTLYSVASLDLFAEPVVLSVPPVDRFFVLQMLSLWTDVFAAPGTRTTGRNKARDFLIVGPGSSKQPQSALATIKSPTRYVLIAGRTQTNGVADYENVHKIQEGYKIMPLSAWGNGDYKPPQGVVDPNVDMKTPPPAQVDRMDASKFFALFAELLKDNPPGPLDYPMIHRLERVGLKVGQGFDVNSVPAEIKQALERATADGKSLVVELGNKASGKGGKGWVYSRTGGAFGVNYRQRAATAYSALGENLPEDAVYPATSADTEGHPLDGNKSYILHFEKSRIPPVDAFWSVTAYDTDGYFIPNRVRRQALGDRDTLHFNGDGSLDIYIQADSPGGDKESNWLPVATAPFRLLMRLYSPRDEVLDGTWTPPPVRRIS